MSLQTNMRLHEQLHLIATVDPKTVTSTGAQSDVIDMSKYRRVMAVLLIGNMTAETVDFKLESDSAAAFNVSAADVVAATQLAAHASNNDNDQIILECNAEDLPDGDRYLRADVETGDSSGGPVCIAIFGEPRFSNEADLASVVEIKVAT